MSCKRCNKSSCKKDCEIKCKRGPRGCQGYPGLNGTPGPIGPTGLVGPTGPGSNSSTTCICETGITGLALGQTGINITADSYLYTQSGNCFKLCGRIDINPKNNFVYVNLNTFPNALTCYSVD